MLRTMDRLGTLRVRDVMTRAVITVREDQTLAEAAAVLDEKRVSAAPVVDAVGRCVGILSAVDFLEVRAGGGHSLLARDAMSRDVRFVGPDELLLKAAQLMNVKHVHRLPVLNDSGRIEGLISTMDIVSAMLNAIDEAEASQFPARGTSDAPWG